SSTRNENHRPDTRCWLPRSSLYRCRSPRRNEPFRGGRRCRCRTRCRKFPAERAVAGQQTCSPADKPRLSPRSPDALACVPLRSHARRVGAEPAWDGSATNGMEYSAMRVVAVTYGTKGDTRPIAALCHALREAGHEALLLGDRSALGSAHALGVPAQALAGDIKGALHSTGGLSRLVRRGSRFTDTARALAELANANTETWMRDIAAAGKGCDAIILSGLAAFAGLSVA